MKFQYIVLIIVIILQCVYGLNNINSSMFKSDELIKNIKTNNTNIQINESCNKLFRNMVNDKFVCVYNTNNQQNKTIVDENLFLSKFVSIYIDTLKITEKDIEEFYENKAIDINIVKNNFVSSFLLSHSAIKRILKYTTRFFLNKLSVLYDKTYEYIRQNIIIDEVNEEIKLPLPKNLDNSRIRYFTNGTIEKYDSCLDFLHSLDFSMCFSTDKDKFYEEIEKITKIFI